MRLSAAGRSFIMHCRRGTVLYRASDGKTDGQPSNPFRSHSLRIGDHTVYTIPNMNLDLKDYFARRAGTGSSIRFPASPAALLLAVRAFYKSLPATQIPSSKFPPQSEYPSTAAPLTILRAHLFSSPYSPSPPSPHPNGASANLIYVSKTRCPS